MQKLLDLIERHLGKAWRDAVENLRDLNSLDDIAERVASGDIKGAVQGIEDAVGDFAGAQAVGFETAAEAESKWLASELDAKVRFDVENQRAVSWAEKNELETVREVTQEQRDLVRRVVADGVKAGRNPREVARDIRDSVGLTDYQAQIVSNYRRALEQGDYSDALGRELTDGRDDRSIASAQRRGRPLSQDQIDGMVDRYRDNWVGFRAETIARTESLRVAHQGGREAMQQAVDDGHVEADSIVREWHHTAGGRHPRPEHAEMNGQTRGLDEPFESGSGAELMYPGDPDADPSETLNCRCAVSTRLDLSKRAPAPTFYMPGMEDVCKPAVSGCRSRP